MEIKSADLINTVKRILRNYKLFGQIAVKKPMLSGRHIHNRIEWCKSYGQLLPSFGKDIIFSDEYRVKIYSRKREYVHRPLWSRYGEKYITKTVKYDGKSLMVLSAIKEDSNRILIRCPDWINSVEYEDVLKRGLLQIYEEHNIFQ